MLLSFAGSALSIAMFELALDDGRVAIVEEKHYRLVPASEIGPEELRAYGGK